MKVRFFDWDEVNELHVARHAVEPEEVEEVFDVKPKTMRSREGRYVAMGKTAGGRYLFVVYQEKGNGELRVITARDMTEKEKRFFKR